MAIWQLIARREGCGCTLGWPPFEAVRLCPTLRFVCNSQMDQEVMNFSRSLIVVALHRVEFMWNSNFLLRSFFTLRNRASIRRNQALVSPASRSPHLAGEVLPLLHHRCWARHLARTLLQFSPVPLPSCKMACWGYSLHSLATHTRLLGCDFSPDPPAFPWPSRSRCRPVGHAGRKQHVFFVPGVYVWTLVNVSGISLVYLYM